VIRLDMDASMRGDAAQIAIEGENLEGAGGRGTLLRITVEHRSGMRTVLELNDQQQRVFVAAVRAERVRVRS